MFSEIGESHAIESEWKCYAVTIPDCAIDFIEELTLMAKIVNIRKEIYSLIFLGFRKILMGVYTLSLRSLVSIYQNSHWILVVMIWCFDEWRTFNGSLQRYSISMSIYFAIWLNNHSHLRKVRQKRQSRLPSVLKRQIILHSSMSLSFSTRPKEKDSPN